MFASFIEVEAADVSHSSLTCADEFRQAQPAEGV
jgi:hypothetical protein